LNFTTLKYENQKLHWIDQTRLPSELVYKSSSDYTEIITAIKRLEIRGAPAIGIAAAYGIVVALLKENTTDDKFVMSIAQQFKDARPTAINLFWAVDRMLDTFKKNFTLDLLPILENEAIAIHKEDEEMCKRIGENGASLINNGDTILTHCNAGALATGGIGTALGVIYTCHNQGKQIKVYADETRPLLQGSRLTAWELQQENIDVTLITDNTAGMLMRQGRIDHIIVGADRVTKNGDVANKIGTYTVAVLAKENNIPFYVALPSSTFDNNLESGDDIIIEERSASEITEGFGPQTAPDKIDVYSPAFDITPAEYVSYYVTDTGLKRGKR
jgi:methylthioribose-1-phosphate isomerase